MGATDVGTASDGSGRFCVKRVRGWVENRAWPVGVGPSTQYITALFLVLKVSEAAPC